MMQPIIRSAAKEDLKGLTELYSRFLNEGEEYTMDAKLIETWDLILADPLMTCIVAELEGQLVSSCTLAIVQNLTRGARPYGVIENVVTHEGYRNQGLGKAVLKKAQEIAMEHHCYKLMLMTGRKQDSVMKFYESAGFERGSKTAFQMRFI